MRPGDGADIPDALDPAYVPDELDLVSADAAADAMIYSFYGRLSVASLERLTDTLFFSPHVCSSRRRRIAKRKTPLSARLASLVKKIADLTEEHG